MLGGAPLTSQQQASLGPLNPAAMLNFQGGGAGTAGPVAALAQGASQGDGALITPRCGHAAARAGVNQVRDFVPGDDDDIQLEESDLSITSGGQLHLKKRRAPEVTNISDYMVGAMTPPTTCGSGYNHWAQGL
eukprot:COSAG01_NODE_20_length_38868_cov_34.606071_12_plen_133_part_00